MKHLVKTSQIAGKRFRWFAAAIASLVIAIAVTAKFRFR